MIDDPNLSTEDLTDIKEAIHRAYSRQGSLQVALSQNWGLQLGDVVALPAPYLEIIDGLVEWAHSKGRALDLLAMLWRETPGNPKLKEAAQRLLPSPAAALNQPQTTRNMIASSAKGVPASLEAMVNPRSQLINFGAFLEKLKVIGSAICRVETPVSKGTGFLIGPNTVMTNYHVVEKLQANLPPGNVVTCRFDYWNAEPGADPKGTPVKLRRDNWLRDWSPYSDSDLGAKGQPTDKELDYALLVLDSPMNASRIPLALSTEPPVVMREDVVTVLQHAKGAFLGLAWGVVTEFPGNGLRYRYDVTTDHGSSGAPLFAANLDLIGLHHAADPANDPIYNQSVPLWRIARELEANNILLTSL
ncbi:trypsin-like peptidase domain-containing protein [Asticcacaulis sp. SL142]|uniref:trypsin-like peptidase domain-containing protein n=1 Tax=Asticcacaulis sp. SL142 TaxID=2995155 RepID=UPI00226CD69D|nr:trypsin-like peptidase domain-containing protein [Asticcacaulis sp. SL142]WAC49811.1 trypsin-like peptidase domain-containing protein [Asticcacaulis sp. SL142]